MSPHRKASTNLSQRCGSVRALFHCNPSRRTYGYLDQITSTSFSSTTPSPAGSADSRRTKPFWKARPLARSKPLACRTCEFQAYSYYAIRVERRTPTTLCLLPSALSNVKHIEEIRAAGYELPDVNQIEVSVHLPIRIARWRQLNSIHSQI